MCETHPPAHSPQGPRLLWAQQPHVLGNWATSLLCRTAQKTRVEACVWPGLGAWGSKGDITALFL